MCWKSVWKRWYKIIFVDVIWNLTGNLALLEHSKWKVSQTVGIGWWRMVVVGQSFHRSLYVDAMLLHILLLASVVATFDVLNDGDSLSPNKTSQYKLQQQGPTRAIHRLCSSNSVEFNTCTHKSNYTLDDEEQKSHSPALCCPSDQTPLLSHTPLTTLHTSINLFSV